MLFVDRIRRTMLRRMAVGEMVRVASAYGCQRHDRALNSVNAVRVLPHPVHQRHVSWENVNSFGRYPNRLGAMSRDLGERALRGGVALLAQRRPRVPPTRQSAESASPAGYAVDARHIRVSATGETWCVGIIGPCLI